MYVLILIFIVGGYSNIRPQNYPVVTAEFNTVDACLKAGEKIYKQMDERPKVFLCEPKGVVKK